MATSINTPPSPITPSNMAHHRSLLQSDDAPSTTKVTTTDNGEKKESKEKKPEPPPQPRAYHKNEVVQSQHVIRTKIFSVCPTAKTWEDAEAFCKAKGGHLAAIKSPLQNKQIKTLCKGVRDHSACWIGLHRPLKPSKRSKKAGKRSKSKKQSQKWIPFEWSDES